MKTIFDKMVEDDDVLVFPGGEQVLAREVDLSDDWVLKELMNAGFFDEIG